MLLPRNTETMMDTLPILDRLQDSFDPMSEADVRALAFFGEYVATCPV
jgi:hypothetical protein